MLRVDNLATLSDFYEFTMLDGFISSGMKDKIGYYDIYFRQVPDGGGFVIALGLESIIEYIKTLKFVNKKLAKIAGSYLFNLEINLIKILLNIHTCNNVNTNFFDELNCDFIFANAFYAREVFNLIFFNFYSIFAKCV